MAAGDRNTNGTPKDIVRHYLNEAQTKTMCGRKNWGYGTRLHSDTDCKSCLKKLNNW